MAIEDAACLGLVFSKEHFRGDIREALEVYEKIRKPRATRVQAASQRARENIYERIGMYYSGIHRTVTFVLTRYFRILEQHEQREIYRTRRV